MSDPLPDMKPAKAKAAKIPRPMNAFMIFAKEHRPRVKKDHPTEENHVISIRLGNIWASLSREKKNHYQNLSWEAANEHRRKYPDYRYEPKPKIKKKRRYDHYLLMDKLRTAAVEAAREQKEEREAAKQGLTGASRSTSNITAVSSAAPVTYTATTRSSWPNSAPAPHITTYASEAFYQYPKGYYYTQHPNLIPAHSQSGRPQQMIGSCGSGMSDPYMMPFPTNASSPEIHYTNQQPLDMTTAGNRYKTQTTTTDKSGKVYCELTTAQSRPLTAQTQFVQNFTPRNYSGVPWADQNKMPCGNHINPRPPVSQFPPPMFDKTSANQALEVSPAAKPGDGKAGLVWIPCEADFAKKLGWSLDATAQGRPAQHISQ